MMKIALAILLIAHGLVHAILAVARSSAPGGETRHFFHRGGTQLAPASFRDERFSRAVDWNEFSGFVYPGFYPHRPWYFWRDRVDPRLAGGGGDICLCIVIALDPFLASLAARRHLDQFGDSLLYCWLIGRP